MADNPTSAKLVLPDVDMLKWISKGPLTVSKVRLGSRGRNRVKRCQIGWRGFKFGFRSSRPTRFRLQLMVLCLWVCLLELRAPQKLCESHWCVPFTATFSKRRKIGALWSECCDDQPWNFRLLQSSSNLHCLQTQTHMHGTPKVHSNILTETQATSKFKQPSVTNQSARGSKKKTCSSGFASTWLQNTTH